MKLFGININLGEKPKMKIKSADKEWVEGNLQWLAEKIGYPMTDQVIISEKTFPKTLSQKQIKVENIIMDCCGHLALDSGLFAYQFYNDTRDISDTPYTLDDQPLDCYLAFDDQTGKYFIGIANSILKHPKWLVSRLCYELVKAKLIQDKIEYDTATDTKLFLYLACVHFGYGMIISQNLTNIGVDSTGGWETKWSYTTGMPEPVIAYALALFATLKKDLQPSWRDLLPTNVKKEFDMSIKYLSDENTQISEAKRIDNQLNSNQLFELASQQYESGEIKRAIKTLEKAVLSANDNILKAVMHNNIGYYKLRLKEYLSSITDFENALKDDPNNGFANSNLGFALIMLGELEKGKKYLQIAIQTKTNDSGYTCRNIALYFHKKKDFANAEMYFKQAFDMEKEIDLLDFFYGQFLLDKGDKIMALEHIKKSAALLESEGIELLNQLQEV